MFKKMVVIGKSRGMLITKHEFCMTWRKFFKVLTRDDGTIGLEVRNCRIDMRIGRYYKGSDENSNTSKEIEKLRV